MTTPATSENSHSAVAEPRSALALRIYESGKTPKVVPLCEGKSSIGSSPRCQVCLSHPDVQPLHCLIVCRDGDVAVTRWASGVQLNESDFTTAPLEVGDKLTLGAVELEVVSVVEQSYDQRVESASHAEQVQEATVQSATATSISPPAEKAVQAAAYSTVDILLRHLSLANRNARVRCQRLVASLREQRECQSTLRNHTMALENELQSVEGNREQLAAELAKNNQREAQTTTVQAAEIEQLKAALVSFEQVRDQLMVEKSSSAERREELETALAERENRLNQLQGELESTGQQINQSEHTTASQADEIEQLKAALASFEQVRDQLLAEQTSSDERREELEADLSLREKRLAELTHGLEETRNLLQQAELAAQEQNADSRRLEAELEEMNAKVEQLSIKLSVGDEHQKAIQQVLGDRDTRIEELQTELKSVRAELEQSTSRAAELEQKQAIENQELASLQAELQSSQAQWEEAKVCQAELQSQRDELQEQLQGISRQSDDLKERCTKSETELAQQAEASTIWQEEQSSLEEQLNRQSEQIETLQTELESSRQQLARSSDQLERLLDVQEQNSELEARCAESESELAALVKASTAWQEEKSSLEERLNRQSEQIEALQTELESARRQSTEDGEQLKILLDAHEQTHALEDRCAKNESELVSLSEDRAIWQTEKRALEEQIEQRSMRVDELQAELESARQQSTEADDKLEQLQRNYNETVSELEASREHIKGLEEVAVSEPEIVDRESNDSETDINNLVEREDSAEQAEPETGQPKKSFEPPKSFIEQYSHLLEETGDELQDNPCLPEAGTTEKSTAPVPSATLAAGNSEGGVDDDAALEAYMSNMMRRVRGESAPEFKFLSQGLLNASADHGQPEIDELADADPRGLTDELAKQKEGPVESLNLESLVRSSNNRPLPVDLSAMRKLANTSARGAIASHQQQRHLNTALSKLITCAISVVTSVLLILWVESYTNITFIGGCVAAVGGLYWGVQLLGVLLSVVRAGRWDEAQPAEIPIDEKPLPISGQSESVITAVDLDMVEAAR